MLRTIQLPQSLLSSRYRSIVAFTQPFVKGATRSNVALARHPMSLSTMSTQLVTAPQAPTYRAG